MYRTAGLWPDKLYLKILFRLRCGRKLDLKNPQSFNEKCQWLKLYNRRPEYITMVDKYAVKEYVSNIIGSKYVIPALGVWNSFDDIDFDELPEQFVLKCTHNSGASVVVKDKSLMDKEKARKVLEQGLKYNYYKFKREWPYKDCPPRIVAERYIDSLGNSSSVEYKLTCMDGQAMVITVCTGPAHSAERCNDNFSRDWKRQDWYASHPPVGGDIHRPAQMDEIIRLSEKLSEGIPQVRVDWYLDNGNIYFGEFTFFTMGGFAIFTPAEWDYKLGEWIPLPEKVVK